MEFSTFAEFLAMGKHGAYVWSAFGITLVVVLANIIYPIMRKKTLMVEIKRKVKREQAGL